MQGPKQRLSLQPWEQWFPFHFVKACVHTPLHPQKTVSSKKGYKCSQSAKTIAAFLSDSPSLPWTCSDIALCFLTERWRRLWAVSNSLFKSWHTVSFFSSSWLQCSQHKTSWDQRFFLAPCWSETTNTRSHPSLKGPKRIICNLAIFTLR